MVRPNDMDTERPVRESNTIFKEIFYQSPIGILLYDKKGRLTNANDSALKIARIPKLDDVLGTNIFDNPKLASKKEELYEEGLIKFQDSLNLIKIKEQNIYNPLEPKIIEIDWIVSVTDSGYLVQIQDINESKKSETALRLKEVQFEVLTENIELGVALIDETGRFVVVNPAFMEIFGLDSKLDILNVNNQDWSQWNVYDEDNKLLDVDEHPVRKVAISGKPVRDQSVKLRNPGDNNFKWLFVSAIPILNKDGGIKMIICTYYDVSSHKKDEEALKISEAAMDAFFESSPGILNLEDENFCYLNTDPTTPTYFGLTRDTIKGKCVKELVPEFMDDFGSLMKQVIDTGKPQLNVEVQSPVPGKQGKMAYWQASYFPVPLPNDKTGIGIIGVEITDIKKAEEKLKESEERFHDLANNIPNLAWMADANGWIFWYNKQWYEYTGTTFEEMQGWGWQKVHHPDYVDSVTEEWSTKILEGEPYDNIFPLKGKNGDYRWFLTRITPITDEYGKVQRWFGTNTDITVRKNIEENLQITMEELKQSNKELEQFAYITSHDLREPLRMITSFLQLLERRYKDRLDQDAEEFIGFAVDGAKRLDAMTNDLLQYSKITNEKRENIPVDFEHVLEHALTNLKVQIEENNAIITHDPLPTIKGDEQLKIQLFQNIIGNAIKYRSQETPKIHISSTKEKNHYLFSIKDNGIGMPPQHLERIFTIFKRLHTHEEYEGTGIGLSIAQKIVNHQGGQIWAESELGKGTTLYFTILFN